MTRDEIETMFTRPDGSYAFARWGRPIAPVVVGVDDATLAVVKGAIEAVAVLAGHDIAETDPELGVNLMIFFLRDWAELADVPGLDRLVPGLAPLLARLQSDGADQYRMFRLDAAGAICAAFVFLRMDAALSAVPARTLALEQVVKIVLSWSDAAFRTRSPLARLPDGGGVILRPDIADLIRAAYDPVMPVAATDASHALRLAARTGRG